MGAAKGAERPTQIPASLTDWPADRLSPVSAWRSLAAAPTMMEERSSSLSPRHQDHNHTDPLSQLPDFGQMNPINLTTNHHPIDRVDREYGQIAPTQTQPFNKGLNDSVVAPPKSQFQPDSPEPLIEADQDRTPATRPPQFTTNSVTTTIYLPIIIGGGDNSSEPPPDPEIPPPLENGITITPGAGGTLALSDQTMSITFQPNGLPEAIVVVIQKDEETVIPPHFAVKGPKLSVKAQWLASQQWVYQLDPAAQPARQPGAAKPEPVASQYTAIVTARLPKGQIVRPDSTIIRRDQGSEHWTILETQVDPDTNLATAETDRLGTFVLVENAATLQPPLASLKSQPADNRELPAAAIDIGIIVDDGDPGYVPHERDGTLDFFWPGVCAANSCYNGDAQWTYNRSFFEDPDLPLDQPWNWVEWFPTLPTVGWYYVHAWIPGDHATTSGAQYKIYHASQTNSVTVDQGNNTGQWVNLGAYDFTASNDNSEYVYLNDVVPEQDIAPNGNWSYIGFDAMRFVFFGTDPPPVSDLEPPVISNINLWSDGLGKAVIEADVTDNVGVAWVKVTFNGVEYAMNLWAGNTYAAVVPVRQGQNTFFIEAGDLAGNIAREPASGVLELTVTMDGLFGQIRWMGYTVDPINTGIGNYIYSYQDIEVIALGPDVVIERWHNAQSLYDGPFGIGWTFTYDMRLTEVDNLLFSGAQIRYADGHTANFSGDGAGGYTPPDGTYDELEKVGDEFVLTMKDQTTYRFNAAGRLTTIADQDDNQITLNYAGENLTQIVDASGRVVALSYDDGRITAINIPDYGTLQYGYTDGRLTSVTDTEGSQAQYEYDADGYIAKIISPNGNPYLTEQTYDDQGRVIFQKDGDSFTNKISYDDANNTVTIVDAGGRTNIHTYDDDFRLIEAQDDLGHVVAYTYNDDNERLTVTDKNGHTTTYDDNGNPLTITDPLGNVTILTYDDRNNLTSRTDALGHVFTYEYDAENHLIRLTDPLGGVIEHTYNAEGLLIRTVDALGNNTETAYNTLGLPIQVTDALGNVSTLTYDGAGHLLSQTDAEGNTATYEYNSLGLPISITDPEGYVTTYEYDADHNLIRETGPDGHVKTYTYDVNGRLVAETDWAGHMTTYEHDDLGRKILETDPLGHTQSYAYDTVGNLASFTDKRGATTSYSYDPNGNLLTETDALGQATTYIYDALNRVVAVNRPCACPSRVEQTEYDALGRVTARIDALGHRTEFEYDALGRQTRRIDALGHETRQVYDLNGNLIEEIDALGNVTRYEYDPLNQQVKVINRLGNIRTSEYDKSGRLVATTDERGNTTRYGYDGNNRLIEEIDALGHVTRHTYDGRGNRLSSADALGRVTTNVYDANSNLVSTTNPRGFTTTYEYDALNRQVKMTDALGGVTTYTYDPAGARLAEIDPAGYTRQTSYDILGRRIAETDRNGNTTQFEYDPAGNLVRTIDALGGVTSSTYDANNNRLTETNALGHTTSYEYDALNRQVSVIDALGGVSTQNYDALGRLVETVDANGNATQHAYDAEGRLIATTDALGNVTNYAYDATGNQIEVIDRNGQATLYTYDALNRQVSMTNALGHSQTTRYDAVGNRIEQVNFRGFATRFEYDANNNLSREIDALGGETTYQYDALDRLVAETDANGHTTTYSYDAVGNRLAVTLPEGQTSSFTYDGERNRLTFTNAKGLTTGYVYDALNRQISETDPLGHVTRTEYDAIGQTIRTIDAEDNATSLAYDPLGRLVSVTDALGFMTTYGYDPVGNRLSETDANGQTTTFTYDALNRLVQEVNPIGSTWRYTYDPEGNLIRQVDANGQVINYEFDAVNQLVTIRYPDSSQDVSLEYDPNGNLIRMVDAIGVTALSYDALDRESGKIDPYGYELLNGYDAVGNRLSITYPDGGVVSYAYNGNDWLIRMTDASSGATTYSYDPDGLPIRTDFPNATWTEMTYDDAGRLVRQFNGTTYNAGLVTAYDYTLDAVGNRLQTIERYTSGQIRTNTKTYLYNARYELLQAVETYEGPPASTVTTSYTYDPAGNRLSMTTNRDIGPGPQPQPQTTNYTYDVANRMLTAGTVTFTYDANGNRLSKLTPGTPPAQTRLETYEYDVENRLTLYTRTRTKPDHVEQRVYNVYDGLGRRLNKGTQESAGVIKWTEYALDGLSYDQLAEFPQTGPPRVTQLYRGQGNDLVSMDEIQGGGPGSQYWFASDGLGSVAATTKQNGQSAHEYFYDPYGQIIDENGHWEDSSSWTNPHNHYLLTGKEWDEESRLYYFGARFYDAKDGVWLTQDPYRGDVNSPMTKHRYLYVRNNPINRIDPLGFFDWDTGQIEWGDTLWQIARDGGVTVEDLLRWNPQIKDRNLIIAGQYLSIPSAFRAIGKASASLEEAYESTCLYHNTYDTSNSRRGNVQLQNGNWSLGSSSRQSAGVNCPRRQSFDVGFQVSLSTPNLKALGLAGFIEFNAGIEDSEDGQVIRGSVGGGIEWDPIKNNKALFAVGELFHKVGLHIVAKAQGGFAGKIEYNICKKTGDIQICGFLGGSIGIEARQQGVHGIFSGEFTRQRAGIQGLAETELCLSLCNGDLTWVAWKVSWSAYANFGNEWFNRTYEFGGELGSDEPEYLTTWEKAAILGNLGLCN